jgi:Zn-dependent peptidase ImmA (M78 family)
VEPEPVSREKLYEEVWSEPMTTVAKRYDVSSNFLARICERLHVPHPLRGY